MLQIDTTHTNTENDNGSSGKEDVEDWILYLFISDVKSHFIQLNYMEQNTGNNYTYIYRLDIDVP